ncbi:arginyl-tRNA--protein transferase 1 isoform X3 [Drosophila virilis]|uniref:Arginyl-tRNA--protein transferase 1 n=1 Tax=Drosophila virilis TaxID=7244 RepID=A0A0Q9W2N8_DROVI|nr:arginyl-tRNA--protein transferase 1 isoform X3 [Drosophila virilis]KRF79340.1 uncharacterized protein Dvir_GJ21393, isoform C [Drosophila virilis]
MSVSIVQYYGDQTSKCGYCTGTDCSKSHGMHAYRLTCDDYQELIDRGWRRCGNYCYKPQNDITCCPCYTIKCDALEFKLTKSNKRILRRMNKFLRDGKREPSEQQQQTAGESKTADDADVGVGVNASDPQPQLPDKKPSVINVEQVESLAAEMKSACPAPGLDVTAGKGDPAASLSVSNKCKTLISNLNPPRKKAKQMRLERRQAKLGAPLEQPSHTKTLKQEKSLKDFLAAPCETDKHHLKHQTTEDAPDMGYGSFHHQYWLDGKLIAVGVIDILPGSVSSVYFFYDPDYSFLSLGTYGSLREIDLVQTIAERVPALKYYYMGFYIHSCPKMRYKGKLSASYLLCPETYVWVPLTDAVRSKLDVEKYQRLNPDATAKDVNEFLNQHLNDVMLLLDAKTCVSYNSFVQLTGVVGDRDVIIEYSKLVGRVCAQRMLFVNMS